MLSLFDRSSIAGALSLPLEPRLRDLIANRISGLHTSEGFDLTDLTHFLIVESGDTEADILGEVGFSPLVNPLDGSRFGSPAFQPWWDWLQDQGGWFELIVTVGDSGFAYVLFISDRPGTEPQLLSLCRTFAE